MFSIHGCVHMVMLAAIAMLLKECILLHQQHDGEYKNSLEEGDHAVSEEHIQQTHHMYSEKVSMPVSSSILALFTSTVPDEHSESVDIQMDPTMDAARFISSTVIVEAPIERNSDVHDTDSHWTSSELSEEGSSVWCFGEDHTDRICRFKNLCYFPEEQNFLFLHSEGSIVDGVPKNRFNPALLDLSSIEDHNTQYFNYIDVPAHQISKFSIDLVNKTSLIMRRFNPDNIMHVIHDDLLPLMHTLQFIQGGASSWKRGFDVVLVFMEGWLMGEYFNLYHIFSLHKPLLKEDLNKSSLTCFRDAYVGLSKATTWYQYGFKEPQGPISDSIVTAIEIKQFTTFVKNQLNISSVSQGEQYVVLVSRKHNRLIVNEVELTLALVREVNMKVVSVGVETHSLTEIITTLGQAAILIGMHGSLLSLSMFLPPGAILLELFPYAVNPNHYTPYRTLTEIPGMNIVYRAWRNMDVKNTVVHPDQPWETGGIAHLSPEEQDQIMNSHEVPPHLCCRNPEWLFRIYQDTIIDIPSLLETLRSALQARNARTEIQGTTLNDLVVTRMFPSPVLNLKCDAETGENDVHGNEYLRTPSLHLSWEPPWNVKYLGGRVSVKYEVWIQEAGQENYSAWILGKTAHLFTSGLKPETFYNIWVRCIFNDSVVGPFNEDHISCST